jgi:hypothetical protein
MGCLDVSYPGSSCLILLVRTSTMELQLSDVQICQKKKHSVNASSPHHIGVGLDVNRFAKQRY